MAGELHIVARALPGEPGVARAPARRPRVPRAPMRSIGIACTSCALAFLAPGGAGAGDFDEFRIPRNRSLLWSASFGTSASSTDLGQPTSESSIGNLAGDLSNRVRWFSDSDPALTLLDVSLAAAGNRSHRTAEGGAIYPFGSYSQVSEDRDRRTFERWALSASQRRYPWAAPAGFEAAVAATGLYDQSWNSRHSEVLNVQNGYSIFTRDSYHSERWTYEYRVSASLSAGWGRVRNATGVYDARVLEQRLRETGALTRPLSAAARRRLAELLYTRGALGGVRERPGRTLWREIERILKEDGALGGDGIGPFTVLRGEEPHLGPSTVLNADGVPTSPVARLSGIFFGPRLLDSHQYRLDRQDASTFHQTVQTGPLITTTSFASSARNTASFDQVEGGVAGEIHRPLGMPWQLDATTTTLLALRREETQLDVETRVSLVWLAADRWTAAANASSNWHDEDRTTGPTGADTWYWNFNLGVTYYLEDRAAIRFTASDQQQWTRGSDGVLVGSGRPHLFVRSLGASLGVDYRLSGWFQMPGFFP